MQIRDVEWEIKWRCEMGDVMGILEMWGKIRVRMRMGVTDEIRGWGYAFPYIRGRNRADFLRE